jgi:hypothetical protein
MKQEDTYALEGDTMTGTIYNGEPNSEPAFRSFVTKAKRISGFLPSWWDKDSLAACIAYSRQSSDFSLAGAQEKSVRMRMMVEQGADGPLNGTSVLNVDLAQAR